jgi:hypothetical protein
MGTHHYGRSRPRRAIEGLAASILAVTWWTAGASAQTGLQNGNFLPGTASNAPTAAWSQIGATNNGLTPALPGWTLTGPNNPGIVCLALTNTLTTSTQVCGSNYNATVTQVPPGPGTAAGDLPAAYTGDVVVADANPNYDDAISQTVLGLLKNTTYTLTFYYSGAQQSGFTGSSLNDSAGKLWCVVDFDTFHGQHAANQHPRQHGVSGLGQGNSFVQHGKQHSGIHFFPGAKQYERERSAVHDAGRRQSHSAGTGARLSRLARHGPGWSGWITASQPPRHGSGLIAQLIVWALWPVSVEF